MERGTTICRYYYPLILYAAISALHLSVSSPRKVLCPLLCDESPLKPPTIASEFIIIISLDFLGHFSLGQFAFRRQRFQQLKHAFGCLWFEWLWFLLCLFGHCRLNFFCLLCKDGRCRSWMLELEERLIYTINNNHSSHRSSLSNFF